MIAELIAFFAYLFENCTGVVVQTWENRSINATGSQHSLLYNQMLDPLEDFTAFDPEDTVFQEYDPPEYLEADPKAWKLNLPTFKMSLWDCLKNVLLIQAIAGGFVGVIAVAIVFLDFSTVTWCYDETPNWYKMPKSVQHLRVIAQCVESFFIQFLDIFSLCTIFPMSLIKNLNLMVLFLIAGFTDVIYRLNLQMFGIYQVSWKSFPLNGLFSFTVLLAHFRVARHFYPQSLKSTMKLYLKLSAQFFLGFPVAYFLVYRFFSFYVHQEDHIKVFVAGGGSLIVVIPKVVSRIAAQSLNGIIHPGAAHVLVAVVYGISAVVFRVMQAELTSIELFIALGIAHAITDLLERITITMRDHIWEYLYRLVRRQRSRQPKYRTPRSRRFIADMSIQIMMQESSTLITALGFITVYQSMYSKPKPFVSNELITDFFIRAGIGLSIDLFFNTFSLLIQTRVMNVAVNRVWKKKWRHHVIVNCVVVLVCVMYFSEHLFQVVRNKYISKHAGTPHQYNCTFPSFLQTRDSEISGPYFSS